jgi:multisubunit Na+/H+ antiporter MnhE subunit
MACVIWGRDKMFFIVYRDDFYLFWLLTCLLHILAKLQALGVLTQGLLHSTCQWLLLQVFLSSLFVAKLAWRPNKIARDPKLNIFIIDNIKKNNILLTIFANSVTLTPGTATCTSRKRQNCCPMLGQRLARWRVSDTK